MALIISLLLLLSICCSEAYDDFNDTKLLILKYSHYFRHKVLFNNDTQYSDSVVLANYACCLHCPLAVLRPVNETEIQMAVNLINELGLNLVVRGGGHSYTCQSVKSGSSIMIDMRNFNDISMELVIEKPSIIYDTITLGTGLTWQKALNYLNQKGYITVHGQCTSVGVAGFSLHGGVHFGGLSEMYGLSSDNIVGLTAVLANSSLLQINYNLIQGPQCFVDNSKLILQKCDDLFFAFRGAGSSLGIVTTLSLRIYKKPVTFTALSIISVNLNHNITTNNDFSLFLYNYFNLQLPQKELSITLFGLDAYFKSYSFIQVFSHKANFHNFLKSLNYDISSLTSDMHFSFSSNTTKQNTEQRSSQYIHFVVEASWPKLDMQSNDYNNNIDNDKIYQSLQLLHSNLKIDSTWKGLIHIRPWIQSSATWSVSSYDLVWGTGHSYGAASIITNNYQFRPVVSTIMSQYMTYLNTKSCDECVVVIHKVGDGLRQNRDFTTQTCTNNNNNNGKQVTNNNNNNNNNQLNECLSQKKVSDHHQTSFHPFRHNATLWVEIDCGHYYRHRSTWPTCQTYLHDFQYALDTSIIRNIDKNTQSQEGSQYPNVPNLNTTNWKLQYYGEKGYRRLVGIKTEYDPFNLFAHVQSIIPLDSRHNSSMNSTHDKYFDTYYNGLHSNATLSANQYTCQQIYDKKINQWSYQVLLIIAVIVIVIATRHYVLPPTTSAYLMRRRMQRKMQGKKHISTSNNNNRTSTTTRVNPTVRTMTNN